MLFLTEVFILILRMTILSNKFLKFEFALAFSIGHFERVYFLMKCENGKKRSTVL
jgi:hypothetical protein